MIIVYKQLHFALNKDLGFSSQNIINISHGSISGKGQILIDEFKKIPGVLNASSSFGIPGLESTRNGYRPEGTDQWHMFHALHIDKNFFDTYQIQIIKGRNFNEVQYSKNKPCLINETLAKKMNWDNPVGKYLFRDANYEIIGVVKDFHVSSMFYKIPPLVISQEYQEIFYTLSVSIRSDNLPNTLKVIEKKWTEINPNIPFTYSFLDDLFGRLYRDVQKTGKLLLIFTGISILVSMLGLFGITFLMLNTKIKEIGIRKINGAKISNIVTMLNSSFIKWVFIAFIIASPISWYVMQKWLDNFAYKTEISWWVFALAGMIALGISVITVSWQSWRAATRNPVEALRNE
jgi:putative ABC transport system permease protein